MTAGVARDEERWRLIASGRIVLVNSQTERLFGHHRERLVGRSVDRMVPTRFRGRHGGYRAGYYKDPGVRALGSGLELYGLRADGSEFPVEISLSPLETEAGLLVANSIRDLSGRKRASHVLQSAHAALSAKTRQLEVANRVLEAFSYSVAHDLRAPLRGMLGFAQILIADYDDKLGVDGRDALAEITGNAKKMSGTKSLDLLMYVRMPVDFHEFAATARLITRFWVELSETAPLPRKAV